MACGTAACSSSPGASAARAWPSCWRWSASPAIRTCAGWSPKRWKPTIAMRCPTTPCWSGRAMPSRPASTPGSWTMDIELGRLGIEVVPGESVEATLLAPQRALPAVLFVHGWGGSQTQDLSRAREVAALGCVCLTFDLRGHRADAANHDTVTRAQNLDDLCACYDWLAAQADVDAEAVAVVGVSYGGYLAAILSALRPVRWLALRTPALYLDRDWELPKRRLHDDPDLVRYRHSPVAPDANRALRACQRFEGDALLVEAGRDEIIPRQVIDNY